MSSWRQLQVIVTVGIIAMVLGVVAACGGGEGPYVVAENPNILIVPPDEDVTINLGTVNVGEETIYAFAVQNDGTSELAVQGLRWSYTPVGDGEADRPAFTCTFGDGVPCDQGDGLPFRVAPRNSQDGRPEALPIQIRFFRYNDDLERQARLVIESSDQKKGDIRMLFRVSESAPRLSLTPSRAAFDRVAPGTNDTRFHTMLNAGSQDLIIDRFTLDAAPGFAVVFGEDEYLTNESTRAGIEFVPPLVLAPNSSESFQVIYAPTDPEPASGTLKLRSNDPRQEWTTVPLEANMSGPVLGVRPAVVDFGRQFVGRAAQLQLQLFSKGTEPIVITSIGLDEAATSPDYAIDVLALRPDGPPISAEAPLEIPVNGVVSLPVTFTPDVENPQDPETGEFILDLGEIIILNNSFIAEMRVPVQGYGAKSETPIPVIRCDQGEEVVPQTVLQLHGEDSYAAEGQIQSYEWRVDQPVGSQSVFIPSNTFPSPRFEANVAGTYVFWLDVWDQNRTKSAEPAKYEVQVIPDQAIHIELLWTTPGDPDETDEGARAGADVDLHFMHPLASNDPSMSDIDLDGQPDPYFHPVYDCYWYNPRPNWGRLAGEGSSDDDPRLDRDDTDGAGPENINLNVPEYDTEYQVGVHYWDDHGFGASLSTVRVYIYENLRWSANDVRLVNLDMWCVAFVHWPSGAVRACSATGGGHRITPSYRPDTFFGR